MAKRDLHDKKIIEEYFSKPTTILEEEEGTRDLHPSLPFIISGGTNTEKYYFDGINQHTSYKFSILPKYFGDESNYFSTFPKRIEEILSANPDAVVFCVFDYDTIYSNKSNLANHKKFIQEIENFKGSSPSCQIEICPSMPSIEYWFLLHFENYTNLIKTCGRKINKLLSPYMSDYFPAKNAQRGNGKTTQNVKLAEKSIINKLKEEECLKDLLWVNKLCADGKLDGAIQRAENNIKAAEEGGELRNQSYSYVYLAFKNYGLHATTTKPEIKQE